MLFISAILEYTLFLLLMQTMSSMYLVYSDELPLIAVDSLVIRT